MLIVICTELIAQISSLCSHLRKLRPAFELRIPPGYIVSVALIYQHNYNWRGERNDDDSDNNLYLIYIAIISNKIVQPRLGYDRTTICACALPTWKDVAENEYVPPLTDRGQPEMT